MRPPAVKPLIGLSASPFVSNSATESLLKLFIEALFALSVAIPIFV